MRSEEINRITVLGAGVMGHSIAQIAAGAGYFFDEEMTENDVWEKEKNWNVGGGVGMEYLMGKRWSLQIEGDFAHLGSSGDIKVIPQAGIYYYW